MQVAFGRFIDLMIAGCLQYVTWQRQIEGAGLCFRVILARFGPARQCQDQQGWKQDQFSA